ncbi:MAG: hypothetical protein GVY09_12915 [Gammaproteobacteria bacterium]|jgi:hypothetical protein|nr:hypothetical protein [Gammaproteobacteria bacterium]
MTGGVLEQLLIELAGLDLGEAMLALAEGDRVPIDCAYLNLLSRRGQVSVEHLSVDTRDTLFIGGGGMDLAQERLDLVVQARPKDASLPAVSSPLRLHGPLADPRLEARACRSGGPGGRGRRRRRQCHPPALSAKATEGMSRGRRSGMSGGPRDGRQRQRLRGAQGSAAACRGPR